MDESVQKNLQELDTPARLLLRAADWIERYGWVKGTMAIGSRACTLGALSLAAPDEDAYCIVEAENRFRRALPEPYCSDTHGGSLCAVAAWNDAPGRTKEEVIAKLRAVALSGR